MDDYLLVHTFLHRELSLRRNPDLGYLPALDGLRGLAVLTVMLFHFKSKPLIPGGGIVGVDLFFALSGFLITTLLLQEWAAAGNISLKRFYGRRFLRLVPALLLFLCVYMAIGFAFQFYDFTGPQTAYNILVTVAAIGTYSLNWVLAYGGDTAVGTSHLWSLSIEEQFYFVWPFLLLSMLRLRANLTVTLAATIALVTLSALLPYLIDAPRNRFYYGTDFRLQTLLLGAILAQLYVSGMLTAPLTRHTLFRVGVVASLAFLVGTAALATNRTDFLFYGGHSAVAVSAGLLIVACAFKQRTLLTSAVSHRVLVYVGRRSYALYIWHHVVAYWLRSFDPLPQVLLGFALSFLAAELSYRLVESPALRLKSRLGGSRPSPAPTSAALQPESNPNAAA